MLVLVGAIALVLPAADRMIVVGLGAAITLWSTGALLAARGRSADAINSPG